MRPLASRERPCLFTSQAALSERPGPRGLIVQSKCGCCSCLGLAEVSGCDPSALFCKKIMGRSKGLASL